MYLPSTEAINYFPYICAESLTREISRQNKLENITTLSLTEYLQVGAENIARTYFIVKKYYAKISEH